MSSPALRVVRFRIAAWLPAILMLASPLAMAQKAGTDLNPYASDVRRALAAEPARPARPGLDPASGESSACRELRMRMDRARNAAPTEQRTYYSGARRDGQASSQRPVASVASDPLADAEQRYRSECN